MTPLKFLFVAIRSILSQVITLLTSENIEEAKAKLAELEETLKFYEEKEDEIL
jgi:hypothetical protein